MAYQRWVLWLAIGQISVQTNFRYIHALHKKCDINNGQPEPACSTQSHSLCQQIPLPLQFGHLGGFQNCPNQHYLVMENRIYRSGGIWMKSMQLNSMTHKLSHTSASKLITCDSGLFWTYEPNGNDHLDLCTCLNFDCCLYCLGVIF